MLQYMLKIEPHELHVLQFLSILIILLLICNSAQAHFNSNSSWENVCSSLNHLHKGYKVCVMYLVDIFLQWGMIHFVVNPVFISSSHRGKW
jgi:hypothetical protein